jgi:hypothetical protein
VSEELHGRGTEVARLEERLVAAEHGRGGVVVVAGEPGIGKSALVESIAGVAARRGFRVLIGRAWELGDAPAYFPVRSGLRALEVSSAAPTSSDADAFGLWEDVLEALARASAKRPILWVIEDLHAADAQTIDLVAYLAQPLRAAGALVVATLRTGDPRAASAPLQRLMRVLRDRGTIELAALREADVAALAAKVAGRALPAKSTAAWMARTGGNPLFVVECARAVRAGRDIETALPETVVDVVKERLGALPTETRGFLELGALLGRELTATAVARLTGRLPAMVIDAFLPVLRAGLMEELSPGQFRFAHALVRDAIEESMPAERRRAEHARIEASLAESGDAAEILVERARHALCGLGVVAEGHAGDVIGRAVARLEHEGARDRAFVLWRRWLDARAGKPEAAELLTLSRLATAAGNHGEARRAAEAASALAKQAEDPARVAEAALALGANPRPGVVDAAYVRILEDALARLPPDAALGVTCLLRVRLAAAMQPASDPSVPVAMAREAIATARACGDDALFREVLFVAGAALTFFVDAAEARAVHGELLELSLAAGDSARALRAFTRVVVCHLELGDFAAFDSDVGRMFELARATGHPALSWRPLLVGSMRALARGNFDESERLVTEIEEIAALIDDPALAMSLLGHKVYRALALDDEHAIRSAQATMMPETVRMAGAFGPTIRSMFALRLRDRAAAAAEIPALLEIASRVPADSPLLGSIGEAVALAGTTEQRTTLLGKLLPLDGREIHTAIPCTYEGPIARVLGLLEASLGRTDAASARLEAASRRCRTLGLRPWVARLALERAEILLAEGRGVAARALLDEAASLAADLGMPTLEARARGGQPPTPAQPWAPLVLEREGEVWKVTWAAHVVRVRDSRGIQLLAKLVASPGERIHVLALAGDGEAVPESHSGEALDARAVAAYRARLTRIDATLADAEGRADGKRMDELRRERDMLAAEISRAVGLGGRPRKVGSATERARVNVTRRLKDATARIAEASPELGRHLDAEVRTGTYCRYGS